MVRCPTLWCVTLVGCELSCDISTRHYSFIKLLTHFDVILLRLSAAIRANNAFVWLYSEDTGTKLDN
jgi:hypothetical protein